MEKLMLPCFNKMLFGIECMGCGAQRAALLLLKGEFSAAFFMYPAIYSLGMLFSFLVLNLFFTFNHSKTITMALVIINAFIITTSYVIKMGSIFLN